MMEGTTAATATTNKSRQFNLATSTDHQTETPIAIANLVEIQQLRTEYNESNSNNNPIGVATPLRSSQWTAAASAAASRDDDDPSSTNPHSCWWGTIGVLGIVGVSLTIALLWILLPRAS